MHKLFFDLESTGINPYASEMLTGYFMFRDDNNTVNTHDFRSRVNKWSVEAANIHKITYDEMLSYPLKDDALDGLIEWLSSVSSDYDAVVFANPNTEMGFLHYDCCVLQMELMNHLHVDNLFDQPFQPKNIISVHTLAKEAAKDGYLTPVKGDSGRASFSQVNVYKALFNCDYDAHDAESDVLAMIRIYDELNYRLDNNIINREQLELI